MLVPDIAPALDIDGATAAHPGLGEIHLNIMDPLVEWPTTQNETGANVPNYQITPDQFEPRLAESWSYDEATTTWTFNLRQGVLSCAGNEFTADDVIYYWERAKSVSGAAPIGWFLGNVAGIFTLDPLTSEDPAAKELTEVTKVDDYTVQIKQLGPNETFPKTLAITYSGIFDSAVMRENATDDDPWSHEFTETVDSPGFGPYCIDTWNKGSEFILRANENYWGGTPPFQTVTIRRVPQSANRVAAIQSGDADVVKDLTPTEIEALRDDPNVVIREWRLNKAIALGMSYNFEPWNLPNNKLLRQAIAYAMPYDEIIQEDYKGNAEQWKGLVNATYFGYKEIPTYSTDIVKAQELMAEAGFPNGEGLEQYGDAFLLHYVAERQSLLEPIANRIATALAQIGIPVVLNPIPEAEFNDRALTKADMGMFIRDFDRPLVPDAGYTALLFYVSTAAGGLNNQIAYANDRVDELFGLSQQTVGDERLANLEELQDILMDELPVVPIAEVNTQVAMSPELDQIRAQVYDQLSAIGLAGR